MPKRVNHIIVVSDIHAGSSVAVCPPTVHLDDEGEYRFSKYQAVLWAWWREFWDQWVPKVTNGQPYAVVVNGDIVDGQVKRTNATITASTATQHKIAKMLLEPVKRRSAEFYVIRGTEAHVGLSAEREEAIAQELGAIGNEWKASRWDLWYELGDKLIHFSHHIGATSSTAFETAALNRELVASFVECGQWNERPPDMIVRSHRHRHSHMGLPTESGEAVALVTPGWQLHTPYSHRLGQSMRLPQIGGLCIIHDDGELYWRAKTWAPKRTQSTGTTFSKT